MGWWVLVYAFFFLLSKIRHNDLGALLDRETKPWAPKADAYIVRFQALLVANIASLKHAVNRDLVLGTDNTLRSCICGFKAALAVFSCVRVWSYCGSGDSHAEAVAVPAVIINREQL